MIDKRKEKLPCVDCGGPRERRAVSGLCKPCSSRRSLYPSDSGGMRECIDCKVRKPFNLFGLNRKLGATYVKHQCKACYNQARRGRRVYSTERPYTCPTCHEARVWAKVSQCRPCFRETQRVQMETRSGSANERETYMPKNPPSERMLEATKHDADQLRAKALSRKSAEPEKYIEVAHGETWRLSATCRGCAKPILLPGRCYECATRRPRQYLRAEERVKVA